MSSGFALIHTKQCCQVGMHRCRWKDSVFIWSH